MSLNTSISFPEIVNYYITPGEKVAIRANQPEHLVAGMTRRGATRLSFKLSTDYCKAHLPEAYNNSLLDINLAKGTIKLYPKALEKREIYEAFAKIARTFVGAGMVGDRPTDSNFNPFLELEDARTAILGTMTPEQREAVLGRFGI